MLFILLFLFLNNVKVNGMYLLSGPTILLISLGSGLFFFHKAKMNFLYLVQTKKILQICVSLVVVTVVSFFVALLYQTYDYSFTSIFLRFSLNFIGCILYSAYHKSYVQTNIAMSFVYVYVIQAFFQMTSFAVPEFGEKLNVFRGERQINHIASLGYRGNAIGEDFFSLALSIGFTFILFAHYKLTQKEKITVFEYILLLFLVIGGLLAARTYLIGFTISILYYNFYRMKEKRWKITMVASPDKKSAQILAVFSICLVLICGVILKYDSILVKMEELVDWGLGFLVSLFTTGDANDASLDILFGRMYFELEPLTFLFGDGYYTGSDGSYYMHTDAGYMRVLLYFGVGGLFLLLWHQCNMLFTKKEYIWFELLLLGYILILHIKGDVLAYGSVQKLILIRTILIVLDCKEQKGKATYETIGHHGDLQRDL